MNRNCFNAKVFHVLSYQMWIKIADIAAATFMKGDC